ncbi:MAG: 50S ribosomal protein L22 [Pseudomonadota bacterium]
MGKPVHGRRVAENEAQAVARAMRVSPRKLNLVAALIRGKAASAALAELTFSKRRIADQVKKVLEAAIANAENNHQLDVDRLFVAEAFVGRAFALRRLHARARGRAASIMKPFSHLTVTVRERKETA